MVKCTRRGLVVKRPGVLSKVQTLNLVLGVGVFSLLPNSRMLIHAMHEKFCIGCSHLLHLAEKKHLEDRNLLKLRSRIASSLGKTTLTITFLIGQEFNL